jgi:DNA-binding transcriptional LysR family regulator
MPLELRDLEVFVTVEREGSFGRAANVLMVSQPAVSERIRHLERVVGRQLFERTTRGTALTAAGTAFLPHARRCLHLADESIEAARGADGSRSLVVAVHSTFAPRVVPLVLGALDPARRRLGIRDVHSEDVASLLFDGAADIGFALSAAAPRGIDRVALPPDHIMCVATREHPLTATRRLSVRHFRDALVAVNAWGDGAQQFIDKLNATGIEDWRIRYCGDAATALSLANQHGHVAFVTRSAFAATGSDTLGPLPVSGLGSWRVRLDLLHRRTDRADPLIQRLRAAAEGP